MNAFGLLIQGLAGRRSPRLSQWVWRTERRGRIFVVLAATVLALSLMATPAVAWWDDDDNDGQGPKGIEGDCPGEIFKNTKLIGNIIWRSPDDAPCVLIKTSNIKLDLDGFFISVAANPQARAIAIENASNVRIEGGGGFVVTAYSLPSDPFDCTEASGAPCAIHAVNSSNVRIRELIVRNLIPGAVFTPEMTPDGADFLVGLGTPPICAENGMRGGAGIVLQNVYGARISDNILQCYNNGIILVDSNGDGREDHLAHNFLFDNANAETMTTSAGDSVGLFFINSSGWLVSRNTFTGNGGGATTTSNSNVFLVGTSTKNKFQQNTWNNNAGPGVTVGAFAVKNTFFRNHVTWSSGGLPNGGEFVGGWDMGDQNSLGANKYQRNRCRWQTGPGVPLGHCDPTLN